MPVACLFREDTKALDSEPHQYSLDPPQCVLLCLHPSADSTFYLDRYNDLLPLFLLILHQQFSSFTSLGNSIKGLLEGEYSQSSLVSLHPVVNVLLLLSIPIPLWLAAWRRRTQLLLRANHASGPMLVLPMSSLIYSPQRPRKFGTFLILQMIKWKCNN